MEKEIKKIHEIELNFSNVCTAECVICSRPHGYGNKFFMDKDVFYTLVNQLKDIDFKMVQTSGNGEAFLNPNYLDYIKILKDEFPHVPRWTYNNFSMVTKERADRIVEENLFTKIHVRIDSLQKWIFERNSNLNQENVFDNLKYFLSVNENIPIVILYNNINDYYDKCRNVLRKRPIRDTFSDEELVLITREEQQIKNYFQQYSKLPLNIFTINHCLWGERRKAQRNEIEPCPKWNVINNVTWICPNGDVNVCCYDDTQSIFTCGNIMKEHLLGIFYGEKRKEILNKIKTREWKEYPCINPLCCSFGAKGGQEPK